MGRASPCRRCAQPTEKPRSLWASSRQPRGRARKTRPWEPWGRSQLTRAAEPEEGGQGALLWAPWLQAELCGNLLLHQPHYTKEI